MFGISFPSKLYLAGSLGSSVQMVMFAHLFGVLLILSPLYRCFITIRQIVCLGHLDLVLIQFALVVLGLVLSQCSLFIWGRSWPSIVWLSPLPRTCACWWVALGFWSFTWAFPWLCEAFPLSYVWGRSRLVRWLNRCGCSSSSAFCAVSRAPFSPPLNDHRL